MTMTPYYQDEWATIYHGDCREVLSSIDAAKVVTDPPYGMGHYEADREVLTPDMLRELAGRSSGVAVFGYPERLAMLVGRSGLDISEWVTWWPTNGAIKGFNLHGLWKVSEAIAIVGRHNMKALRRPREGKIKTAYAIDNPHKRVAGFSLAGDVREQDVWRDAAPGLAFQSHRRLHPNEKPISLMTRLIRGMVIDPASEVVMDPFMGSGTTLRAAKDLGIRSIGIEIDERHCETAATRLSATLDLTG